MAEQKRPVGRPPLRGEAKRSAVAVRTTEATKAKLLEAATASGRSLTQEIEQRLEQSIERERVEGDAETSRLLMRIAAEIAAIQAAYFQRFMNGFSEKDRPAMEKVARKKLLWHKNREIWGAVKEALATGAIEAMGPDHPADDDVVTQAHARLEEVRAELGRSRAKLLDLGVTSVGGMARYLASDEDRRRDAEALPDDRRGRALALLDQLAQLESAEIAATSTLREALAPYLEVEEAGRRFYRERRRRITDIGELWQKSTEQA